METPKISNRKDYKIENKDYHRAMTELRRSSAASPQDNRPNRERSRADNLRASVKRSRDEWD
jgi:hypothetical protein